MKRLLVSSLAVLAVAGMASAAGIVVESKTVDVMAPGFDCSALEVLVSATGGDAVAGVDLWLKLEEPTCAKIVNLDTDGTGLLFAGEPLAGYKYIFPDGGLPDATWGMIGDSLSTGTKPATGTLAKITLNVCDCLATLPATIVVSPNTPFGPSNWGGEPASQIGDGVITLIPEPATALLLLGFLPFLRRR